MRHYAQGFEPISQRLRRVKCYELMELPKSLVAGSTSPKYTANLIINVSMGCNSWLQALIGNGLRRLKGEV